MSVETGYSDPVRAAEAVIDRVGRRIKLAIPVGIGKPNLFVNALFGIAAADRSVHLRILTGLSLVRPRYKTDLERRFVAPLLERQFGSCPDLAYAEAMRSGTLPANVEVHEFFLQAGQWLSNAQMQQSYASLSYSHVAAHLEREEVNVLAQLVAVPAGGGGATVSLGSNPDVSLDLKPYVAARRAAGAPIVVAGEINRNMPYMAGQAEVATSDFDVLLSPPAPHYALFAPPKEPVSLADYAMAIHAATLVKDGGTLQIGIGSFSDALTHALILRHTRNDQFRAIVAELGGPAFEALELAPFRLGLYGCSELLVDGFLALRRAGILKRQVETPTGRALVHAGFFLGNRAFYDELAGLPDDDRAQIAMSAISFTNTLRGDHACKVAQRSDARFINTALVATLMGAVSSDSLEDGRVISGIGGQGDFVAQAHELPGARSIIAVRSTRQAGRGRAASNIVWQHSNTSVPRQLRDVIVTEYGIADLRGRTDREVVEAMLGIADSRFQDSLLSAARRGGKLQDGFSLPTHARNNTPEEIARVLGPARSAGLLPVFPLGTEMSDVEQSLLPALGRLRNASYADLVGLLWRGVRSQKRREGYRPTLERLGLWDTADIRERVMAALVLGALIHDT